MSNNKKKVLIVDDSKYTRLNLINLINRTNYATCIGEASNGYEAVTLYKKLAPDLTTMDIVMPEMDGINAIERIMKIDKYANIIVISAIGQQMIILEALTKGAKDFVRKPIIEEDFKQIMENLLLNK